MLDRDIKALLKEAAGTLQYFVQKGQANDSVAELIKRIRNAVEDKELQIEIDEELINSL